MKKLLAICLTILMTLPCFVACSSIEFKVNFIVDGVVYGTIETSGQEVIALPENPTKEGSIFKGWFWDPETWSQPFTANSLLNAPLTSDMRVYAYFVASDTEHEDGNSEISDGESPDDTVSGGTDQGGNSGNSGTNSKIKQMNAVETYILHPQNDQNAPVDQFTDGLFNYHYFRIGEIHEVPVFYSEIKNHSGAEQTITITKETSVEKMVEKTTAMCISQGIEHTLSTSFSATIGDEEEASVTAGISASTSVSFNSSVGKSFTESLSESFSNGSANTLSLDADDANGCYRYLSLADFDVFLVLVSDLEGKTTSYKYLTSVQEGSVHSGWYFGADESEMKLPDALDSSLEKLEFDTSSLLEMDLYEELDAVRFVRRIRTVDGTDRYVPYWKSTDWVYCQDLSKILNSEAVSEFGFDQVKITIEYTTKNNDGVGKSIMDVYTKLNGNKTTIDKQTTKTNGSENTRTFEYTISLDDLRNKCTTDSNLYIYFTSAGKNDLDMSDNHYWVLDIDITVELVRSYN